MARATPGGSIPKQRRVDISAEASTSPDGSPLRFDWTLVSKPSDSAAALSATTGPVVSFVADTVGGYSVSLAATGTCTSVTTIKYVAFTPPPLVTIATNVIGKAFLDLPVTLSGTSVSDPDGGPVSFQWRLISVPVLSSATIADPASSTARFTPDRPGTYVVGLDGTDRFGTRGTSVSITAVDRSFLSEVPHELFGNVGRPVSLDAGASTGVGDPAFSFQWAIVERPPGSFADVTGLAGSRNSFTPDAAGSYRARLTVLGADAGSGIDVPITVWTAIQFLPFVPVDAEYDRPLDRIVFVANDPPAVHVYDPFSISDAAISLPSAAVSVGVSPDGKTAVVAHQGAISFIDLEAVGVLATWPVDVDAADVAVTDVQEVAGRKTRFALLLGGPSDRGPLHAVDLGTGVEGAGVFGGLPQILFFGGTVRALPASSQFIAVDGDWVDPQHIFVVDVGADAVPTITHYYDARTTPCGGAFWISEDARQLLCAWTQRLWMPGLIRSGFVDSVHSFIWWADAPAVPSPAAGRWLIQPMTPLGAYAPALDTSFLEVDAETLGSAVLTPYPRLGVDESAFLLHGRIVSWDRSGSHRVTIVIIDEAAQVTNYVAVLLL